jgi:hypothetical protein
MTKQAQLESMKLTDNGIRIMTINDKNEYGHPNEKPEKNKY